MPKKGDITKRHREFDQKIFEGLCKIWCTKQEIQNIFKTNNNTIDSWCKRTYNVSFAEAYDYFACEGKASLRRNQFALSKNNAAMAIWLGKQVLGQRENNTESQQFDGKLAQSLANLHVVKSEDDFSNETKKVDLQSKEIIQNHKQEEIKENLND